VIDADDVAGFVDPEICQARMEAIALHHDPVVLEVPQLQQPAERPLQ